jgi:predicted RNA methylase
MRYLLQCVSGLQDVVAAQLDREPFGPVRLLSREEGLLVFDVGASPRALKRLPYANNTFLVLGEAADEGVEPALKRWCHDQRWQAAAAGATAPNERTFRLVLSDAGRLVGPPPGLSAQAADVMTRVTGLRRNPSRADAEFWFIRRQSGKLYFCKRVSQRAKTERDLAQGELRPELVWLILLLSEPAKTDIVLDPFAGSGAIPLARAMLAYNMIFCVDVDDASVARIKARLKAEHELKRRKNSPIIVRQGDARRLERIADGFIDKVITDPPWGFFDQTLTDPGEFYRDVLRELCRVTKPAGFIVLLLGKRDLADELTRDFALWLKLVERHELLVSGRKAVLLKWRRTAVSVNDNRGP